MSLFPKNLSVFSFRKYNRHLSDIFKIDYLGPDDHTLKICDSDIKDCSLAQILRT